MIANCVPECERDPMFHVAESRCECFVRKARMRRTWVASEAAPVGGGAGTHAGLMNLRYATRQTGGEG